MEWAQFFRSRADGGPYLWTAADINGVNVKIYRVRDMTLVEISRWLVDARSSAWSKPKRS